MNRFRKALCVALVLLLLVASVPAVPVADLGFGITASALNATGKCGKTATYTVSVVSASIIPGNSIGKVGVIGSAETFTIDLSAVTSETIVGELTSAAVGTTQFTTATK